MRVAHFGLMIIVALAVSACAKRDGEITPMRLLEKPGNGPDEFAVLPSKPLEAPTSYTDLPAPTPGGSNLTDRNPRGEGIAALGGNEGRLASNGVPQRDGALVRHASRNGTDPAVREKLAKEDEDFRRRKARFTRIRLVKTDRYAEAYKRQTLKPYPTWYKYRRTGVQTPAAPPRGQ